MPIDKDIITTEIIKSDYKNKSYSEVKSNLIWLLLATPVLFLLIYATIEFKHISVIIFLLIYILAFCYGFVLFIKEFINRKNICNQNFKIITDTLIDKEAEIIGTRLRASKPNILHFKACGKYLIPACINYSSAKQFAMCEDEVFRSSKIGDEFYLVIDNKNKILMSYNTKFFEFQE